MMNACAQSVILSFARDCPRIFIGAFIDVDGTNLVVPLCYFFKAFVGNRRVDELCPVLLIYSCQYSHFSRLCSKFNCKKFTPCTVKPTETTCYLQLMQELVHVLQA